MVEIEQFYGLSQLKEVIITPVPYQGLGDGLLALAATGIPHLGQLLRVPYIREDGADDPHPGGTSDIADNVLELDVHLRQSLLHMLDVVGGVGDQHRALAQVAAQHADLVIGPEGAREQPKGVKLLDPLTVHHVTLAAGNTLQTVGIDEQNLEAVLLEDLEQRDPVDTCRLHRDRLDAVIFQMPGQLVEILGEGTELLDGLFPPPRGQGHPVFGGSHIDAGGIEIDLLKLSGQLSSRPRGLLLLRASAARLSGLGPFNKPVVSRGHGILHARWFTIRIWRGGGGKRRILLNGITPKACRQCHRRTPP